MPKHPVLPDLRHMTQKKGVRGEQFLAEMDAVVSLGRLLALIVRHYTPVGLKGGRPPMPPQKMLRVNFLQKWHAFSGSLVEKALCENDRMRRFVWIKLGGDHIPDETTSLNFRHMLERHDLTVAIFADGNAHLADKGITLRSGTLVDASIVDARSFTENGNVWSFGSEDDQQRIRRSVCPTNAHISVGADSGATLIFEASTVKVHYIRVWEELLHGKETSVWVDKDDVRTAREDAIKAAGKVWDTLGKAPKGPRLHPLEEQANRIIDLVRAKIHHLFCVIKRQFGHVNTRCRRLPKTRVQSFTLFALGNLFTLRRRTLA